MKNGQNVNKKPIKTQRYSFGGIFLQNWLLPTLITIIQIFRKNRPKLSIDKTDAGGTGGTDIPLLDTAGCRKRTSV